MSISESKVNDHSLRYVLDANVFMEASRRYYPLDFAMPFWNGLVTYAREGTICSIDKVFNEIDKGDDELKAWSKHTFQDYFLSTKNEQILTEYRKLVQWAQQQPQYDQNAKNVFMGADNADTWVLAFALANHVTIVTHEVPSHNIKKKIPIPNVCQGFSIQYCDTFAMLRELGFRF